MSKRIDVNTLPDDFRSGQILTDEMMNRIVAVLRAGVNENKNDLDKLLMGYSTDYVFNTKGLADKYLETKTPDNGQIAFVMSDGEAQDTIFMYSYNSTTHTWVYKDTISVLTAYTITKEMDSRVTTNKDNIAKLEKDIKEGRVVALKATQDANGNVITTTYATKSYVDSELAKKAEKVHPHITSDVTGLDSALGGKVDKVDKHSLISDTDKAQIGTNKTNIATNASAIASLQSSKLDANKVGVANGVASLDGNTKVPASQLPSYVDDVLEYNKIEDFPKTGEAGKIYVVVGDNINKNKTYRWSGTNYVVIGSDLALGETSSTAYYGDKGKANRDDINAILGGTKVSKKAEQDKLGNIIDTTYAKKDDVSSLVTTVPSVVQTELNKKSNDGHTHTTTNVTGLDSALGNKVDKVSGKELIATTDITKIASNETAIGVLGTRVSSNEVAITTLDGRVDIVENDITTITNDLSTRYTKSEIDTMLQNVQPVFRGTYISTTEFEVDGVPVETFDDKAIYIDGDTTYRWSGTELVNTTSSLALGETSSTAYSGSKGKDLRLKVNAMLVGENPIDEFALKSGNVVDKASKDANGNVINTTYATNAKVDAMKINDVQLVGNKTLDDLGIQKKLTGQKKSVTRTMLNDITASNDNEIINSTVPQKNATITRLEGQTLIQRLPNTHEDEQLTTITPIEIRGNGKISTNLFDKNTIERANGFYSTAYVWSVNNGYDFYITKIRPNTTYIGTNIGGTKVYLDINKNYISGINSDTFTTPNNSYYVGYAVERTNKNIAKLNEGSTVLPYEPYWTGIKNSNPKQIISKSNNLFDITTYGDTSTTRFVNISNLEVGKTYTISVNKPILIFKIASNDGGTATQNSLNDKPSWTFTLTQASKDIGKLWLINGTTFQAYIKSDILTMEVRLNSGTTALPYQPYAYHEIALPDLSVQFPNGLGRLPNGVYDSVDSKRMKQYTLQASDITGITPLTNILRINVNKQVDSYWYNKVGALTNTILITGFVANDLDYDINVPYRFSNNSNTSYMLFVPLGTYATLQEAQTALTGTVIQYQLTTPIPTGIILDPINTYDGGTVELLDANSQTDIGELVKLPKYQVNCEANKDYFVSAKLTNYTNAKVTNGTTDYPFVNGYVKFKPTASGNYYLSYVKDGINKISKPQFVDLNGLDKTADELNAMLSYMTFGIHNSKVSKLISVGENYFKGNLPNVGYVLFADGKLAVNAIANVSDFIQVLPNTSYTLKLEGATQLYRICGYTSNNENSFTQLIYNGSALNTYTFTTNVNVSYIRFGQQTTKSIGVQNTLYLASNPSTKYTPYIEHIVDIPLQKMASIGSVRDELGKKNIELMSFKGTENWGNAMIPSNTLTHRFLLNFTNLNKYTGNALSTFSSVLKGVSATLAEDKENIGISHEYNNIYVAILKLKLIQFGYIVGDTNTYVSSLKQYLIANNINLVLELAQPEPVVIPEWDKNYSVYNYGMEKLNSIAKITTEYPLDFLSQVVTNTDLVVEVREDVKTLESQINSQDTKITTLENVNAEARLTTLESDKVDKVVNYGLISDTDKAQINTNKTNIDSINTTLGTINTDLGNKVDKVEGSRLITANEATQIETNKTDISNVKTDITTINTNLGNKVDKVANKSLVLDTDIAQITTNKTNIETLNTNIQALNGAKVFRGTIAISTSSITNANLTTRLTDIMKRTPKLGDVLRDSDGVEWYFDGSVWNNYGQNVVGSASPTVEGLIQLGYDNEGYETRIPIKTDNKKAYADFTVDNIYAAMGGIGNLFTDADELELSNLSSNYTSLSNKVTTVENAIGNKANNTVVNGTNNGLMSPTMLSDLNKSAKILKNFTTLEYATLDEFQTNEINAGMLKNEPKGTIVTYNNKDMWVKTGIATVNEWVFIRDVSTKQDKMTLLYNPTTPLTITKNGQTHLPLLANYDYALVVTDRTSFYIELTNLNSTVTWLQSGNTLGGFPYLYPIFGFGVINYQSGYLKFIGLSTIAFVPDTTPGYGDGTMKVYKVYGIKV